MQRASIDSLAAAARGRSRCVCTGLCPGSPSGAHALFVHALPGCTVCVSIARYLCMRKIVWLSCVHVCAYAQGLSRERTQCSVRGVRCKGGLIYTVCADVSVYVDASAHGYVEQKFGACRHGETGEHARAPCEEDDKKKTRRKKTGFYEPLQPSSTLLLRVCIPIDYDLFARRL